MSAAATQTQTNLQDWNDGISVVVPTFRRPEGIKTALGSLLGQSSGGRLMEVIVADNDPEAGARDCVAEFVQKAPFDINYVHVPEPGVSNARNGALEHVRGRFIIFLDDDMEALPGWVENLVATSLKFNAGIVFGPAHARMPHPEDPRNIFLEPYFSRLAKTDHEGLIKETLGTGGCLLDLNLCQMPEPPFDTSLNEVGGEDDLLFDHLRQGGTKVAWSPNAKAWEHVPEKRATDRYIWKRNFAFGQGPVHIHAERGRKGWPGIVRFMCTGTLQFLAYGPICVALRVFNYPSYVEYMAKTARGLGKILWWNGFSPKLYGAAMLKSDAKPGTPGKTA